MGKKFLIIFTVFFIILLIISTSSKLMKIISDYRFSTRTILRSDKYYYGDMFGLSYLSDFKIKNDFESSEIEVKKYNKTPSINLYIAGDSYLSNSYVKNSSLFCGVKQYTYLRVNDDDDIKTIKLIKGEKNILLIETVERAVRAYGDKNFLIDKLRIKQSGKVKTKLTVEQINEFIQKSIYNSNINQNLEFNLFDYCIFTPFKELKASINYKLFNRIADKIFISPDKTYLLYKSTIDTFSWESSFTQIDNEEVDNIVSSLNYVYNYYKSAGFDEVYLSIIPNPVIILYPQLGKYNELIHRIQNNQNLKIPIIDVYNVFKATSKQIYFKSDTHWNNNGFDLWLNEFNKRLEPYTNK
jgi:hypothetical protein